MHFCLTQSGKLPLFSNAQAHIFKMNSHRDTYLFRKYLKRLVHFNQGLVRYSEFLAIDESTPATALRTLSGLMKREFEDDYLGKSTT